MPISPHYYSSYPRGGQVALLCEGDVVGYEVSILRRWLDGKLGTKPLVDLWPCGTGSSLLGISDAIGRSRPIMVIEDRDFRTSEEVEQDRKEKTKNRTERGIAISAWHTWRRNEIENYLLEPEVVFPCLASVFGCSQNEVSNALAALLPTLSVRQAFQYAFYRVRSAWAKTDPSSVLPNGMILAPVWNNDTLEATTPSFDEAIKQFKLNVSNWRDRVEPVAKIDQLISEATSCYDRWKSPTLATPFWLNDWAGKDVLQWLRIALTARFGWRDRETGIRTKLSWAGLNRARRDEKDRPIENELKPFLVHSFLSHLSKISAGELYDEWNGLLSTFRSGSEGPGVSGDKA